MVFEHTMTVAAPIEKVFALVDDAEQLKLWMDGLEETVYTGPVDRDNPVGAAFRRKIREGGRISEYEGRITAYEKPRHFAVTVGNRHFSMHLTYRFTPVADGTRVNNEAGVTTHTVFAWLMSILFAWLTRRILRKQLAKLKQVAEAY